MPMVRSWMVAGVASAMLGSVASAQYSIGWYTIDGGGGTSTGGGYTLSGTIGQPDAGGPMTGGGYTLTGGFWAGIAAESCPADFNGDGTPNVSDLLAFLGSYRNQDPRADVNGDSAINVSDLLSFLGAYRSGC